MMLDANHWKNDDCGRLRADAGTSPVSDPIFQRESDHSSHIAPPRQARRLARRSQTVMSD